MDRWKAALWQEIKAGTTRSGSATTTEKTIGFEYDGRIAWIGFHFKNIKL
jgi:hypothetical protein